MTKLTLVGTKIDNNSQEIDYIENYESVTESTKIDEHTLHELVAILYSYASRKDMNIETLIKAAEETGIIRYIYPEEN